MDSWFGFVVGVLSGGLGVAGFMLHWPRRDRSRIDTTTQEFIRGRNARLESPTNIDNPFAIESGLNLARKIIEAFGISGHVRGLVLRAYVDEATMLIVEKYTEESETTGIITILERYDLVSKDEGNQEGGRNG